MATKRYIVNGTIQTTLTPDNVSIQKVKVDKGGTLVGTRQEINLIEGSNVTLTVADNAGSDRVDVTVAAAATPPTNMASKTTADLTYYVDSDVGSDSNDGLAAGSGHAFLTIQKAVDSIPDVVNHLVTINLAACTAKYAGFYMQNKQLGSKVAQGTSYTITILGTYKAATKTGTMSGTMDSGSTKVITDADAGWTAHELRGLVVYVGSTYYIIRDNTTTTIEIVGVHGSSMSGTYAIKDFGSVVNTNISHNGFYSSACFRNCKGARGAYSSVKLSQVGFTPPDSSGIVYCVAGIGSDLFVDHCSVDMTSLSTASAHAGIYSMNGYDVRVDDCFAGNCTQSTTMGILLQGSMLIRSLSKVLAYGCVYGIDINGVGAYIQAFDNVHADNNTTYGVRLRRVHDILSEASPYGSCYINGNVTTNTSTIGLFFHSVTGSVLLTAGTIESNKHGILIGTTDPTATVIEPYGVGSYILRGSIIVRNNTVSALSVVGNQLVKVSTMTGANATSGAYGIYAREGAKVFITSGTTVSGDTGKDVYMDGTSFTYATDFAANGDAVVNTELGTVVKRIDG